MLLRPRFRANDFEGGLAAGIDLIFKAIRGEYKGSGKTVRESGSSQNNPAGLLIFFFVLVIILLAMRASRRLGGYRYTGGGGPFVSGNWGSGGRRMVVGWRRVSVVSVVAADRVAEAARAAVGKCARTIFLAGSITIE